MGRRTARGERACEEQRVGLDLAGQMAVSGKLRKGDGERSGHRRNGNGTKNSRLEESQVENGELIQRVESRNRERVK